MKEGIKTESLFFATLLSGIIPPVAKMNKTFSADTQPVRMDWFYQSYMNYQGDFIQVSLSESH